MGNNPRLARQKDVVDQDTISSTAIQLLGGGDAADFSLLVARGLGFKGIEHQEYGPGFLTKLSNGNLELLAQRMVFEQEYSISSQTEKEIHPKLIIEEKEIVFPEYQTICEAAVAAAVTGKQAIDFLEGYETPATILPSRGGSTTARALIVGAGATGTYAALQATLRGWVVDIMDADVVDATNLNRQVLYYDAVGQSKAETLVRRLGALGNSGEAIPEMLEDKSQLTGYDIVFSCVDRFAPRRIMDSALDKDILLVDGGSSAYTGRVMTADTYRRLSEQLDISRLDPVVKPGCSEKHSPSIIMPNMIVGSYMVDEAVAILEGCAPRTIYYDAHANEVLAHE